MRPRGNPPTPNALSREIEPVEITETGTMASFDPSRTMDPLPNCFSIWPNARSKARVRSRSSMWDCSPGEDYGEFSLYQWRFRRVCLGFLSPGLIILFRGVMAPRVTAVFSTFAAVL